MLIETDNFKNTEETFKNSNLIIDFTDSWEEWVHIFKI